MRVPLRLLYETRAAIQLARSADAVAAASSPLAESAVSACAKVSPGLAAGPAAGAAGVAVEPAAAGVATARTAPVSSTSVSGV